MYRQREIVLVPFPYSDLSAAKKRPVLIVSNDHYNTSHDDVVVCVITSNPLARQVLPALGKQRFRIRRPSRALYC